jgi:uncharacterized phage infection (PIP) family protein YhgE
MELEEELELEISRVIQLKNKLDPELIEEVEKIEEGLYVEVKMIHETKVNVNSLLETLNKDNGSDGNLESMDEAQLSKVHDELDKYKRRAEKLVKQLIQANEEIEDLTNQMDDKLKEREGELKNELMNKLQEKERLMNEKLFESQRRVEELSNELEAFRRNQYQNSGEVERMKAFFDKKIKNMKENLNKDFKNREKEIAQKAIVVYNKKKEKIYESMVREVLKLEYITPEIENLCSYLRYSLNLDDEVYGIENFSLCNYCGEPIHISQTQCPYCQMGAT